MMLQKKLIKLNSFQLLFILKNKINYPFKIQSYI
jgi:hypothetical protein